MTNILNKLNLDKNKLLLIGIGLIVIIGIPLTIMQSQKQQEIRQRAFEIAEGEQKVTLTLKCKEGLTCDNIEKADIFSVEILLENEDNLDISGFMTTIKYDSTLLELSEFSPALRKPTQGKFEAIINSTLEDPSTPGTIQYAAVNSDIQLKIDEDKIPIGTLTFKGIAIGSATVTFEESETQITALGKETALEVDFQDDQTYTIVPIPDKSISVDLVVKIDGISSCPLRTPIRKFTISPVDDVDGKVTLEENIECDAGSFKKQIHFPETLESGNYAIQTKNTLRKFIGFIDPSQDIVIPQVILALGDVNIDNSIDIVDFNIIRDCFGDKINSDACKAHTLEHELDPDSADFDDDGEVTGIDYNIFLRSLAIREGD